MPGILVRWRQAGPRRVRRHAGPGPPWTSTPTGFIHPVTSGCGNLSQARDV